MFVLKCREWYPILKKKGGSMKAKKSPTMALSLTLLASTIGGEPLKDYLEEGQELHVAQNPISTMRTVGQLLRSHQGYLPEGSEPYSGYTLTIERNVIMATTSTG
jgi:hypothetical protein